ncbi:hypothetical protein Y032_0406g901 [Ancylostoma ceylanicum]|uniref:Uncharacterized protein n=1 Tax=Ancylostoma ceylanicum TaxID=53326 RepID=A0A016X3P2_9BILA|nr:hypothetical protein Y032_0406g901 [Ancylostoma ceylanicum]
MVFIVGAANLHLLTYTVPVLENEEETRDILSTKKKIIQQRHANITSAKLSVDAAVSNFQEAFSRLDNRTQQEEQASQETYLDHAWDLITTAEAVLCKLAEKEIEVSSTLENLEQAALRRQRRLQSEVAPQSSNESPRQMSPFSYASNQIQALLPRLQLPKFGGRRQEWDTFWAIFKANVDEQPIPTMIKFNYLLQALVGEARQTAAQFQVTEGNYQAVMDTLLRKYGRDSSIIEDLLAQLETCIADGPSTKQQAALLEKLTAILMQLTTKGQDVNQRIILNMVMRKFNTDIQTKVLERRERLRDVSEWTWLVLQKDLSDIIDTKEQIERSQEMIKKPSTLQPATKDKNQGKRSACLQLTEPTADDLTVISNLWFKQVSDEIRLVLPVLRGLFLSTSPYKAAGLSRACNHQRGGHACDKV